MNKPYYSRCIAAAAFAAGLYATNAAMAASSADSEAILAGYVASAVATEQCRGRPLSLVEELGLGRVVKAESGGAISAVRVLDSLSLLRRTVKMDCASIPVQEQVQVFVDRVLPQLQWLTSQPIDNRESPRGPSIQ